jgi:hypothetical protein
MLQDINLDQPEDSLLRGQFILRVPRTRITDGGYHSIIDLAGAGSLEETFTVMQPGI